MGNLFKAPKPPKKAKKALMLEMLKKTVWQKRRLILPLLVLKKIESVNPI